MYEWTGEIRWAGIVLKVTERAVLVRNTVVQRFAGDSKDRYISVIPSR